MSKVQIARDCGVSQRDKALKDSQTLRGQLDKLQEQHGNKVKGLVKWLPNLGPGELQGVCMLLFQPSTILPDSALCACPVAV